MEVSLPRYPRGAEGLYGISYQGLGILNLIQFGKVFPFSRFIIFSIYGLLFPAVGVSAAWSHGHSPPAAEVPS